MECIQLAEANQEAKLVAVVEASGADGAWKLLQRRYRAQWGGYNEHKEGEDGVPVQVVISWPDDVQPSED